MTPKELDRVICAWISLYDNQISDDGREGHFWAWEKMTVLANHYPEDAWRAILLVCERTESDRVIGNTAAGPLEDLLAHHGSVVIERVEEEAGKNERFARMLNGVWKNMMDNDIWERVQAACCRS